MSFLNKNIIGVFVGGIFGCIMSAMIFTGCVDDRLVIEEEDITGRVDGEDGGDALTFTIELDKSLASREASSASYFNDDIESKDNWIDMQDKFRVFFFTADGDFLFGANDRIVGSQANMQGSNSSTSEYWYVRIPMTMIVDRKDQTYDIDKIKSYLKNNPFKVAVLANWPNAGDKINPSDYDDSSENSFKQNPSSVLKGEPLWSWENSILNEDADPRDIKNINDLHHIYNDTYYSNTDLTAGGSSRFEAYNVFMNEYKDDKEDSQPYLGMGQPTDWVKMRDINGREIDGSPAWKDPDQAVPAESFDSKEKANQWIRAYWDPNVEKNEAKQIYRHYQHMWFLWNFNALIRVGKANPNGTQSTANSYYANNFGWNDGGTMGGTGSTNNKWGWEWWQRNGKELYNQWILGHESNLKDHALRKGSANNTAYLEFVAPLDNPASVYSYVNTSNTTTYGINLPKVESLDNGVVKKDVSFGYFKFTARTSGTLRIRWGSTDNNEAKLVVQTDDVIHKEYTVGAGNIHQTFDITEGADKFLDLPVSSTSKIVYIWSRTPNTVIYGIEYIRGKYLYDTDREGVVPNEDQGIPMYGVQEYPAIPEWERGTTFNLPSNVSLIRALAKVVLYIPDFGTSGTPLYPRHVYMRCMNRTAHCEPMDVEHNTSGLWNTVHDGSTCEWFNIQKYEPAYRPAGSDMTNYHKYLSWFYGSWQWASWFAERTYDDDKGYWVSQNGNYSGWSKISDWAPQGDGSYIFEHEEDDGGTHTTVHSDRYPHLFNPHINQSEFCSFQYAGSDGNYHKYVLYVPDKFINDPTYPGVLSSTPKVPHIEFRFPPKETSGASEDDLDLPQGALDAVDTEYVNSEFNLDDNDTYRIYFTNYGYGDGKIDNFNQTAVNQAIRTYSNSNYDTYEANADHLKLHWPIMRNHVYEFYVSNSGPATPEIKVKVTDWSHEKVVVDW